MTALFDEVKRLRGNKTRFKGGGLKGVVNLRFLLKAQYFRLNEECNLHRDTKFAVRGKAAVQIGKSMV